MPSTSSSLERYIVLGRHPILLKVSRLSAKKYGTQNQRCLAVIQLDSIASQRCFPDIAHTGPNLSDMEELYQMSMAVGGPTP